MCTCARGRHSRQVLREVRTVRCLRRLQCRQFRRCDAKLTPFSRSTPLSSVTCRFFDFQDLCTGVGWHLSTCNSTLRPTISSASSSGMVSAVLTVAVISPRRITLTVSVHVHDLAQLVGDQDDRLTFVLQPFRMRNRWSASAGVSTPVGSSKIRMSALRYSAFRISTRCCMPTPMSSISASGSTFNPYSSASSSASRAFARTASAARHLRRQESCSPER